MFRRIISRCFRVFYLFICVYFCIASFSAVKFVLHLRGGKTSKFNELKKTTTMKPQNRKKSKSKPGEMLAFSSTKRNYPVDVSMMEKCRKFLIPLERFPFCLWISLFLSKFNSNFLDILLFFHQSTQSFIRLFIHSLIHSLIQQYFHTAVQPIHSLIHIPCLQQVFIHSPDHPLFNESFLVFKRPINASSSESTGWHSINRNSFLPVHSFTETDPTMLLICH